MCVGGGGRDESGVEVWGRGGGELFSNNQVVCLLLKYISFSSFFIISVTAIWNKPTNRCGASFIHSFSLVGCTVE